MTKEQLYINCLIGRGYGYSAPAYRGQSTTRSVNCALTSVVTIERLTDYGCWDGYFLVDYFMSRPEKVMPCSPLELLFLLSERARPRVYAHGPVVSQIFRRTNFMVTEDYAYRNL